ncbi:hypothetical protein CYMTET_32911, partial [Cymbomonas tetramitiformis]
YIRVTDDHSGTVKSTVYSALDSSSLEEIPMSTPRSSACVEAAPKSDMRRRALGHRLEHVRRLLESNKSAVLGSGAQTSSSSHEDTTFKGETAGAPRAHRAMLQTGAMCTEAYPFAYRPSNNLDYCCASCDSTSESGVNCNADLSTRSTHCKNNAYQACSSPPCSDYTGPTKYYRSGPRAVNDRTNCNSWTGTLEEAKIRCDADTTCTVLHDCDCDGNDWRYCSIVGFDTAGQSCTQSPQADERHRGRGPPACQRF